MARSNGPAVGSGADAVGRIEPDARAQRDQRGAAEEHVLDAEAQLVAVLDHDLAGIEHRGVEAGGDRGVLDPRPLERRRPGAVPGPVGEAQAIDVGQVQRELPVQFRKNRSPSA